MNFIKNNLDFVLVISFIIILFFQYKIFPLRNRWNCKNFIYLGLLLLYALSSWKGINKVESYVSQKQREKLLGYAPSYAVVFERLGHSRLNLSTAANDPLYLKLIEYEKSWTNSNSFIADIYTLKKTENGTIALLVDSETDYDKNGIYEGDREARTHIGEVFNKNIQSLQEAFSGHPGFTFEPYTDRWGTWVSAFVPLRDNENKVDSVLALDFPAEIYLADIKNARYLVFSIFTLFFLLLTSYISTQCNHREYRKKLNTALSEAKQASEVKSRFLANMSHELRTPLNAIIGMISLLSYMSFADETKKKINMIKSCSDNLLALINDILDFSKIEAGKLVLEFVEFKMYDAAQEIIDLLRPMAEEKKLKLLIEYENKQDSLRWFSADLTRIRQVLLNLVTNAIKFTSSGTITIRVTYKDINSDQSEIQISVKDTGIGIHVEEQKKLFQSFSQVDASTTRRFGGTGLGLAISKGIVEAMDGSIWVESVPNEGSTFSFKFVAKRIHALQGTKSDSLSFDKHMAKRKPLRILVADDQMPNRLLASNFLSLLGYTAVTVSNGAEVLEAFKTSFYDVVFMDCQMPEMDGFESTIELKKRFLKAECPWIIALTASAYPEDKEKCFQSGMDDFVTKPFSVEVLARAIENISSIKAPLSFDWKLMQRQYRQDESIMFVIIDDFKNTYPKVMENIKQSIETKNFQDIRIAAHKLRGNVANFYAKAIQNNLLELETMAKNKELDGIPLLFSKIEIQIEQLKEDLNKIDTRKVA